MIDILAKWTVLLFGLFLICIGFLMLINHKKANEIIRKAGSTNFINYTEILIRIIPAIGLILPADNSKYSDMFKIFGSFMLLTSMVLHFVPRQIHYNFSLKAVEILKICRFPVNFTICFFNTNFNYL